MSKPTALVTLGRLPKGLDICRALARSGWRVVVAEPSRRHLCGLSNAVAKSIRVTAPNDNASLYLSDMEEVIRREGVSLVVPVSEEIMHASLLHNSVAEGVRIACLPHARLIALHDKFRFSRLAQGYGLAVPRTALLGSEEARALADECATVLKPALTCSGQGLQFLDRGAPLPQAQETMQVLVQEALPGVHSSSFSIAHQGRVIGTVVYRPEIVSGTVSVAFRQMRDADAERQWVEAFVRESGFSGFISFDFIADREGQPRAIECNPRVTSGVHFVEQASLAKAILAPQDCTALETKAHEVMYQLWPVLTETQAAMFRPGRGYAHKMKTMLRCKEANFEWRDPLPVWLQPYAAWDILKRSAALKQSFGEAATHDIAWFGERG